MLETELVERQAVAIPRSLPLKLTGKNRRPPHRAFQRRFVPEQATPPPLAAEIVRRAVSFLPGNVSLSVLEPACGTGVFFSALQAAVPRERIACCQGVKIDPRFAAAARELWHNEGIDVEETDFFEFAAKDKHRGQFNLLSDACDLAGGFSV